MRELGLAGLVAISFGLGSYYVTGELGRFGQINLLAGAAALLASALGSLRRLRGLGTPLARRLLLTRGLLLLGLAVVAVALERGADAVGLRYDWTIDQRYVLSPASLEALAALPDDLSASLYYDPEDPRIRSTRLLLEAFEATGEVRVRERVLDDVPEEIERFGLTSSNSVVLATGDRFEVVGRPTEGSLWEAMQRLRLQARRRTIYFSRGAGEGDLLRRDELGYSGAAAALRNEGYDLRDLVLAAAEAIPEDAAALLVIAPDRPLRGQSLVLLREYLGRGGGLVALLEPGAEAGLEGLLSEWGFETPDGVVVDPASGPIEGAAPGVNPLAHSYSEHPITQPLDANRMVFFARARPAEAPRKPQPDDRLASLVFSSPRAWLSREVDAIARGFTPRDRDGQPGRRFALLSVGSYRRNGAETRIAVFGDSDFASNRYLRSLYNLDLFMNTVHWVARRQDEAITRRPNVLTVIQRPLTPQESLTMFYGVGLLLPELLLIAAGITWLRRRGA